MQCSDVIKQGLPDAPPTFGRWSSPYRLVRWADGTETKWLVGMGVLGEPGRVILSPRDYPHLIDDNNGKTRVVTA